MSRLRTVKTNFTAGEISPELLGRGDLRGYENGAAKLENIFIQPTGGVTRRPGLRHVDAAAGSGRLVAFEFNTEQVYLLLFTDRKMTVYKDGASLAGITTPWTAAQLPEIAWTQNADTLFVCHPEVEPTRITRTAEASWTATSFAFFTESAGRRQPYHRFADEAVTLQPSGTTGTVTLTASADVFQSGHVGTRVRIAGQEVEITSVSSATVAQGTVQQTLASTAATDDWDEQAFSAVRGYPATVTFHQDRLVFGGSRDLPNRVWMSKTADITNFDLGTGLDDEAIEFGLLSDQVNAIRWVFPGRHLQVFTTGAEWMISGSPLTPTKVQARRQTRVGSSASGNIPPRNVDGATLFVARNRRELREFLFTDVEQAYQSTELSVMARHLFDSPVDQDYDQTNRLLHVVMGDGTIATLTVFRSEQVTAWTVLRTDGAFRSVAVVGDDTYVLVERQGAWSVESFDRSVNTDNCLTGTSAQPATTWSGLDHLEGRTVKVVADGKVRDDKVVSGGAVELDQAAGTVEIGLSYSHVIEPLPPVVATARGPAQGIPVRLVRAVFRLADTRALRVDTGRGPREVPFRRLGVGTVLDTAPASFTGDKVVRGLGWRRGPQPPLWRIEQDTPLSCTLLSVTTEIKVND